MCKKQGREWDFSKVHTQLLSRYYNCLKLKTSLIKKTKFHLFQTLNINYLTPFLLQENEPRVPCVKPDLHVCTVPPNYWKITVLHQGVLQMNNKNGMNGQSYWAMPTFSSSAQKYLPMGENKNGKKSKPQPLSWLCQSCRKKPPGQARSSFK